MILAALLLLPVAISQAGWEVWENARFAKDEYHDGDSFKVTKATGRYEYILRLYYVDAPETDLDLEDRIQDQAKYWNISSDRIRALGKAATRFTEQFLQGGFTVYTQKDKARGRSRKNRYYALIQKDGRMLGEELVRAGLARIYGNRTEMPEGLPSTQNYLRDLRRAEKEARDDKRGAWGMTLPDTDSPLYRMQQIMSEPKEDLPDNLTLTSSLSVYSARSPHSLVGRLTPGMDIEIIGPESATMTRVRFRAGEHRIVEALVRTDDLRRQQ